MSGHLTYPEAILVGALQGITELFPVSSLGHSVLIPALLGGRWARDLNVSAPESPYLAFVVGLHVATALALLVFFWRDWVRIVGGLVTSIRRRKVETADERLAWMIVVATIPVGLAGLLLEHTFRTVLGRPLPAAAFLAVNGAILYGAERLRRRAERATAEISTAQQATARGATIDQTATERAIIEQTTTEQATTGQATTEQVAVNGAVLDGAAEASGSSSANEAASGVDADRRVAARTFIDTTAIGAAQILALLPGISRSGSTMAAGLMRGLDHEDAARFSFLLATPVILAAGILKVPDLFGPLGAGIHGQVLAGSVASFVGAIAAVRFLTRYFKTRTLMPFAIYCAVAGIASFVWLARR